MWRKDKEGEDLKYMYSLQRQASFLKVNTVSEHSQLEVISNYSAINCTQTGVRTFVEDFH